MKKTVAFVLLIFIIGAYTVYHFFGEQSVMNDSFTYHPQDQHARFSDYQTNLQWINQIGENRYRLKWRIYSSLNQEAYLRQDISLLYEDGSLIDMISERMQNSKIIHVEKIIDREDSGHFEAITLHHAELHYPNGVILSRRQMSYDQLYVTSSPLSPMDEFEVPQTNEEVHWQKILNKTARQQLSVAWAELIKQYHIPSEQFYRFPLPYLHVYNHNCLPGFTRRQTDQAIGELWDSLYKHYLTGIEVERGKTVSPIGSTVPLVLFAKNGSRFIVLTRTITGKNVMLVQPLNLTLD